MQTAAAAADDEDDDDVSAAAACSHQLMFSLHYTHTHTLQVKRCRPGVKVSRNAPERHCGASKFKPGAFRLQDYWTSQSEPTFLGPAS